MPDAIRSLLNRRPMPNEPPLLHGLDPVNRRPLDAEHHCDDVNPRDRQPVGDGRPVHPKHLVVIDGFERVSTIRCCLHFNSDDRRPVSHDEVEFIAIHICIALDQVVSAFHEESLREGLAETSDLMSKGHPHNVSLAADTFATGPSSCLEAR
jgi:hypothetical protein